MSSTPEDKHPGRVRTSPAAGSPLLSPRLTVTVSQASPQEQLWLCVLDTDGVLRCILFCIWILASCMMTQHHAYRIYHCYGHWWLVDSKTWTCSTWTLWEHLKDGHAAEGSPILWTAVKSENRPEEMAVGSVGVGDSCGLRGKYQGAGLRRAYILHAWSRWLCQRCCKRNSGIEV